MVDVSSAHRTSLRPRRSALFAVLVIATAATGCSKSEPDTITLSAEGPAGPATVTYRTPDGERTEEVTLPWTTSFETSGDFFAEVTVRNPGTSGEVSCRITGARLPAMADGEALARCGVSRSGDSGEVNASGEPFVEVNGEPAVVTAVRLERPVPFTPRAFAIQGDVAWLADGGTLTGLRADGSEPITSVGATNAQGAVTAPDGTVYVVNSPFRDGDSTIVAIAPDLTERSFVVPKDLLAGPIAVVGDEVWAIAFGSAGGEVIRFSAADGTELGRLPGGDRADFASSGDFGAVVDLGEGDEGGEMVLYDATGEELVRAADIVVGGGDAGKALAFDVEQRKVFEFSLPDLTGGLLGGVELNGRPNRIVSVGDVLAAVGENTIWLLDPDTLDPTCTFTPGMPVLGVSETEVWVNVPDIREVAVYRLSDLPC